MKIFTYNQYIRCIHTFRLNAVMQLAEESTKYNLEQLEKNYLNGKLIKNILQDKKEVTKFINQFIEPREKIKEEELTKYTKSNIIKKYKSEGTDFVYKLKKRDVYFLIEYQSAIDNNMSYRMLNYCLDIIQEWSRDKKMGKYLSYPMVVPIIIYTGNQKWKRQNNFRQKQDNNYVFEKYRINLEYNFIGINKFSTQSLLEKDSLLAYSMLLEKAESNEKLVENLEIIIESMNSEESLTWLSDIISFELSNLLAKEYRQKLLDRIEKKIVRKKINIPINILDNKIMLKTTKINKEQLEEFNKELLISG